MISACFRLLCLALLLTPGLLLAQIDFDPGALDRIALTEGKSSKMRRTDISSNTGSNYDVRYHRLELEVDPRVNYINGAITTYFIPTSPATSMTFDLAINMQVDSVVYHGSQQDVSFTHGTNNILELFFSGSVTPLPIQQLDSVTVYYQGPPQTNGLGSYSTDTTTYGKPIAWTLSQPYGAREWWPCKQVLDDKIDSIDVLITTPLPYRAASNGLLVSEVVANNQTTFHWKHRYKVATYLIAFAVTEYAVYSDFAPLHGDTLEILNYVYPEDLEESQRRTAETVWLMSLFDSLFGPYPFMEEKYGHAQFSRGGGMEHQTMSFMGDFGFELLVHELAHQWFGNKVTCGDWEHIWLNEGFATYLVGLAYENSLDGLFYGPWVNFVYDRAIVDPNGSVFVTNTDSVFRIFDPGLSYAKGAALLRMLRLKVGDEAFFQGLRNYLADPGLAYSFALTDNLRSFLEASSGQQLGEFFNDWFEGKGYPTYTALWGQNNNGQLTLQLFQEQSDPSVSFFNMPVPIYVKGEGQEQTFLVDPDFSGQSFNEQIDFQIDSLFIDPERFVLAGPDSTSRMAYQLLSNQLPIRLYPNPTNGDLRLDFGQVGTSPMDLEIFDAMGRLVLEAQIPTSKYGVHGYVLDTQTLRAGTYSVRITADSDNSWFGKFVKVP